MTIAVDDSSSALLDFFTLATPAKSGVAERWRYEQLLLEIGTLLDCSRELMANGEMHWNPSHASDLCADVHANAWTL